MVRLRSAKRKGAKMKFDLTTCQGLPWMLSGQIVILIVVRPLQLLVWVPPRKRDSWQKCFLSCERQESSVKKLCEGLSLNFNIDWLGEKYAALKKCPWKYKRRRCCFETKIHVPILGSNLSITFCKKTVFYLKIWFLPWKKKYSASDWQNFHSLPPESNFCAK